MDSYTSEIGDKLTCLFVDNGLLGYKEGDQVMATFVDTWVLM